MLTNNVYRQRWQATDVPVELAERVICACILDICSFRDIMGFKRQKFSSSFSAQDLYTRQLTCEPQTGTLACFSFAVRNKKKKIDQFSRSKFYIEQHAAMQG